MPELDILQSLQAATNLIGPLADKDLQRRNHAHFTRLAAFALRDQGWGNIRKTSGNNVEGFSVDGLVNPRTSTFSDIIADSDGDHPALRWQARPASQAEISAYEPALAPVDSPGPTTTPAPPAASDEPTPTEILQQLLETFGPWADAYAANTHALLEVRDRLDQLRSTGLTVHFGR